MGTNLSQVFIANTAALESGNTFTGIASTPEIGIWKFDGTPGYVNSALYKAGVDVTDEVAAAAATDEVTDDLTTVAHPLWLYKQLQFVQGTANNPIATPIINTRDIRRIVSEPYAAAAGQIHTLSDNTIVATKDRTFRFVIRNKPTAYLDFYDADNTGYVDLSGDKKQFPLGAGNNTNHHSISVEVLASEYTDFNTCMDKLADRVQEHKLLNNLIKVSGSNEEVFTVRHVGVVIDLIIQDSSDNAVLTDISDSVTDGVIGVGNPYQVLGDELRCRSRYGQMNRMYFPQNLSTYTSGDGEYNKITIEYEHNWPNSSGIAPAGAMNQVVLYFAAADLNGAVTATEGTFDDAFAIADLTARQEFVW